MGDDDIASLRMQPAISEVQVAYNVVATSEKRLNHIESDYKIREGRIPGATHSIKRRANALTHSIKRRAHAL